MSQSGCIGNSSSTPSFPSVANEEMTAGLHASVASPSTTSLPPLPAAPSFQSEDTHSGNRGRKRKEPANKSPMWQYFTRCILPNGEIDPKYCTCNYCHDKVLCPSEKNGTSSMKYHSRKCQAHPLFQDTDPTQARLNRDNVSGGTGYRKWNKKRCDDRCIEMVIKDELPFRFVEKEGFRALCKELEPNWTPLTRKQVAKGVLDKYNVEKALLLSQLKASDTRVSVTTDTWTSIQNINYMVVTAHFLDSD